MALDLNKLNIYTMKLSLLAFVGLFASASAFVPHKPVRALSRTAARPQTAKPVMALDMVSAETVDAVSSLATTLTVASSSGDFGGLAGPVAGLGFLVGLIVFLSPPLAD